MRYSPYWITGAFFCKRMRCVDRVVPPIGAKSNLTAKYTVHRRDVSFRPQPSIQAEVTGVAMAA
jgi:hypothetical protein